MKRKPPQDSFISGRHPVLEALNSGKGIERILLQKGAHGESISSIRKAAVDMEVPLKYVPIEKLNSLFRGNHQGIIAFTSLIEYQKLDNILPFIYEQGEVPLFLILDGITDVRNTGAIARTALGAKVHALIISSRDQAPINAIAIKTSAGALNHIPVCREEDIVGTVKKLKTNGIQIVASTGSADKEIADVDLTIPSAIVLGSEEKGVSTQIRKYCDEDAKVPISDAMESYNVSVATGMMLYECMKQRTAE